MLARVNGTYRKTLAFARVAGAYRAAKNVYVRVGTAWRPVWSYKWDTGGWGGCSKTCGGGTQTRTVRCLRNDGVTMSDVFCSESGAKPATSQSCNTHPCYTYSWATGSWGDCSVPCGYGTQTRSVSCRRNDGINVDTSYCTGSVPASKRNCNDGSCSWYVSAWSGWSTTCGPATRSRTVYCKDPYGGKTLDKYCSGSYDTSDKSTVCTGCGYDEYAYLRNKLKHTKAVGGFVPQATFDACNYKGFTISSRDVSKWSVSDLKQSIRCNYGEVIYHYNALSFTEKVCGHSNRDCCIAQGKAYY